MDGRITQPPSSSRDWAGTNGVRGSVIGMVVLHANWSAGALHIWAECESTAAAPTSGDAAASAHPGALPSDEVGSLLTRLAPSSVGEPCSLRLKLPTREGAPAASPKLAHAIGLAAHGEGEATIGTWSVPTIAIPPGGAGVLLDLLEEACGEDAVGVDHETGPALADSVRFFAAAARFGRSLLAEQRFVPAVEQTMALGAGNGHGGSASVAVIGGPLLGRWRPWLDEESAQHRMHALLAAIPSAARSVEDAFGHDPARIVEDFLGAIVDAGCRAALSRENMIEALEGWDSFSDAQVAWLGGLLGPRDRLEVEEPRRAPIAKSVRRWIAGLEDRGSGAAWRLCLVLGEPASLGGLADLESPGDDIVWRMSFQLQAVGAETVLIDAEDIWALRAESATVSGRRVDQPQDLLLRELGRASRLYRLLERALDDASPVGLELTTRQAYEFLREVRPILIEQGFGVIAPEWWDSPAARIGARLRLSSPDADGPGGGAGAPASVSPSQLGLQALVGYEWQIAIGDTTLTLDEFQKLAAQRAPLVRIGGRWVEVRPEDVRAAVQFIRENPGGEMRVAEALRLAYRTELATTGVPILGLEATGWVGALLDGTADSRAMPTLTRPAGFHGELRPYQLKGLSWLAFLDELGLGPCLADDMGLGKTIQLLALMLHERERAAALREQGVTGPGAEVGPTLLVVPMSIVDNWRREAHRFSPDLRVVVHHGLDRPTGERFLDTVHSADLVITTYALAHRDRQWLEAIAWHRVVLDEAQNIKNPSAKQSQAVRALEAPRRVALTGTPLENRLSELWSIMDFCNPGFLGSMGEFRRFFSVPIERYHDRDRSRQLRGLVRPFILRRLKTDSSVISDLPAKLETKEFCRLTPEQVTLYETCVREMLTEVDRAEGIRRRGIVLTALIRLKQICNHPAQLPRDDDPETGRTPAPTRSGKCIRLLELLEEVIASGAQALVFTQFRQMGHILAGILRHALDREVLFLHGGTPQGQRQQLVDRFQKADGSTPILILSLKAGGVGLNLTAASHVFHFDRWWNPAVENQATDRAFRIGQTKAVNVHKFIVGGTLEERIDQMIESKIALAEDVIGSGEDWLTELSTSQLRDILTLRPEAIGDE